MSRAATVFALLLVLLMQSQAAVWAAAAQPALEPAADVSEAAAMPCHGSAETAVAGDADDHGGMHMACCDDGEPCGNCAAACVAAPALPAGAAQLADYVEAHFASVWQSESVLIPPPLDLLRPPITLLR